MHACGHDGHTSCLVGAVRVLSQIADELEGPIKFIFQPAEEGGESGGDEIRSRVFERKLTVGQGADNGRAEQ